MQRIFLFGLRISKKKKKWGKDISDTLLSFFFKRIKPDNSQFRISKTTCARGCKLSKHERILSYSIFGTLHRRRFHLPLARKPTSSFPRSCYLGRIWRSLTYLAVCLYFFPVKLQFRKCRKFTYLCTLSLKRNASRVSYDTVSPRCTSWKSEKQRKCSW